MLDIQNYIGKPKIIVDEISDTNYLFKMQYLPRGFGNTFGNSVRRVILGYDYGGAITGLKIKGVPHEYETIEGVKESVIDFMLNAKKLRFKVDSNVEKLQWIPQRFKGVGVYNSSSLKLPSGVELLNEDIYLFEITDPAIEFIVDFRIEKGYGYYSLDFLRKRESQLDESDVGLLLLDNDFRVIDWIKYDVQEHIDDFTGSSKDELTIDIKTMSTKINPKDILTFVGEVLSSYSNLFVFEDSYIDKSLFLEYSSMKDMENELLSEQNIKIKPIDAIPLSERTRNALIKNEILYVEDLEKKKKSELLSMKGVGRKAIDEITKALEDIGKNLAG